jgi:hypothetical protein
MLPIEVVIYIHGVSDYDRGQSHEAEYRRLHEGIAAQLPQLPNGFCGIEWGWQVDAGGRASSHELLTDAQRLLGNRVFEIVQDARDRNLLIDVLPLIRTRMTKARQILFYGLSDAIYYISEQGRAAIHRTVAEQICGFLKPVLDQEAAPLLSLTLVGHSAGSLIACDFLFGLFYDPSRDPIARVPKHYLENTGADSDTVRAHEKLHQMARSDHLRVRRLVTLGSPFTPTIFRSDTVLGLLAADQRLDPGQFGLDRDPPAFGPPLAGPRWINIWELDDLASWPIGPLMDRGHLVEDLQLDFSDDLVQAHTRYWTAPQVHQAIAARWLGQTDGPPLPQAGLPGLVVDGGGIAPSIATTTAPAAD